MSRKKGLKKGHAKVYHCAWSQCPFVYLDRESLQLCKTQHRKYHSDYIEDRQEEEDQE